MLRYLAGTIDEGLVMSASGHADDLCIYTDAGFAGPATHAQNGLVILWGGTLNTWRSSRAALSALSTAEAELCSAALGWQVAEGIRYLLTTVGIHVKRLRLFIDNKASLTSASLGSTWRTRYYAVRPRRTYEEVQREAVQIQYCSTKDMAADALTKLAGPEPLALLHAVMHSSTRGISSLSPYPHMPSVRSVRSVPEPQLASSDRRPRLVRSRMPPKSTVDLNPEKNIDLMTDTQPSKKTRRGKPRCRSGSSERRWNQLGVAEHQAREESRLPLKKWEAFPTDEKKEDDDASPTPGHSSTSGAAVPTDFINYIIVTKKKKND